MKNTFLILFCLSSIFCHAQIKIEERAELPYEKDNLVDFFKPRGEKGILQVVLDSDMDEGKITIRTQTYDTNFRFLNEYFISIPNTRFAIQSLDFIDEKVHLTLNEDNEFLRYIIYDFETGDTSIFDYKAQEKNKTFTTKFNRNRLYIVERSKKAVNLVIWDLKTKEQIKRPLKPSDVKAKDFAVQGFYFPDAELDSEDIFILGSIRLDKSTAISKLYHLHPDGIMDETMLSSAEMPYAKDISILWVPDSESYLLFGSYGEASSTMGLFMGKLEKEEFEIVKKYSFGEDFDSLMASMPNLTQKWNSWLKKRAHKKGEEFELDLLTISHPITRLDDGGYLWVAELFHPTTIPIPSGPGPNGSRTYTEVFDGYQTTHAIVARIDLQGELLWDRAFYVLPSLKPLTPHRFLSIILSDNQVNFIYQKSRYLKDRSYNFEGTNLYQSEDMEIITDEDDKTMNVSALSIEAWYGDYLLASGYQKIKNKEKSDKSRKVFSINKLKIEKKS